MRSTWCIPIQQSKFCPWDTLACCWDVKQPTNNPDRDTVFIEILAGFLQGDTLAPHLFIIALDYAVKQAVRDKSNLGFTLNMSWSRWHLAEVFCDTDFSDEIAPPSNSLEQAKLLLSWVETSAKQIGLHINNSKTEYIKFNQGEGDLKALNSESKAKALFPETVICQVQITEMFANALFPDCYPSGADYRNVR